MKKLFFTFSIVAAFATVMLVGCNKEKMATVNKYFNVQNATLVSENFPTSTSNNAIAVQMNQSVLAGGTSIVHVASPVTISKVVIGMPKEKGYYELSNVSKSANQISFTMIVNQNIKVDESTHSFDVQIATFDANGLVSQIWTSTIDLIQAGTGRLQVSLSFDNEKDVDLHLIEPNGEHIYYGHALASSGGELDVDSNAGCSIDGINNENIFYGDDAYIAPGTYSVYVDLYNNCDPSIATNYVVSAFYNGALIATTTGRNPVSGVYPEGTPGNYGDIESLEPVMTFVIPDHGQEQTKTFEKAPLSESAKLKMEMAASRK